MELVKFCLNITGFSYFVVFVSFKHVILDL